ncbi:hypothetical protein DW177_12200 [Blautia sp. AM16-16B]|nr:hypothetical protein DW177_12200 [Blautia sp. AM16-16B]
MNKLKTFLQNFSYTLGANIISTVIGASIVLVLPAFLGVKEYGYWQLYLFYEGYTAYLSFGLSDGAYVKYGGWDYQKISKPILSVQFWSIMFANILILSGVFFWENINGITDYNKNVVIVFAFVSSVIVVPRLLLIAILQTTNRIKEYSLTIIIERIIYLVLVIVLFALGIREYVFFVFADLGGKIISLGYAMYRCRDGVFSKIKGYIYVSFREIKDNISIGIKIISASVAGSLIIGIVRFYIEHSWSVEVFAKISLSISLSNMLLKFITAIAVVLFPIICRTDKEQLSEIYRIGKKVLCVLILFGFVFYYPMKLVLTILLPQYGESLEFMALLFPICIYESKMQLLGNTYFKALRKEKYILIINLIAMVASLFLCEIGKIFNSSVPFYMLIIVICLALRTIVSDIVISRCLGMKVIYDLMTESVMVIIFVVSNWLIGGMKGFALYVILYGIYIVSQKSSILEIVRMMSGVVQSKKNKKV